MSGRSVWFVLKLIKCFCLLALPVYTPLTQAQASLDLFLTCPTPHFLRMADFTTKIQAT